MHCTGKCQRKIIDNIGICLTCHTTALREQREVYEKALEVREHLLSAYRVGNQKLADRALAEWDKIEPKLAAIRAYGQGKEGKS